MHHRSRLPIQLRRPGLALAAILSLVLSQNAAPVPDAALSQAPATVNRLYIPVFNKVSDNAVVNFENIFGTDARPLGSAGGLDLLDQTKAKWLRRNGLEWTWIEPTEGARVWENDDYYNFEQELAEASRRGYQVIVVIRRTPQWASYDALHGGTYKPCGRVDDTKLAAFGNFVYDAVQRLSQPPYNVHHWEIWNEPDVDPKYFASSPIPYDEEYGCYGDETDLQGYGGSHFAKLLQAAYPRIKEADPLSRVYVGGLLLSCDPSVRNDAYCRASLFMRGVLAGGGAPYFDGVSYHGYDYYSQAPGRFANPDWATSWSTGGVVAAAKAHYLRAILAEFNVTGKTLLFSEGALLCWQNGFCPLAMRDEDYEASKAWYVPQLYAQAMAEGLNVVIWHSLKENQPPLAPDGKQFGTGLLDYNVQPRYAYTAFQYAANQLAASTFVTEVKAYPNVRIYEFDKPGHKLWIGWSITTTEQTVSLPSVPLSVTNPFYPLPPPTTTVTLDVNPTYIEWAR